jgi:hypothetical protein
MCRFKYDKEYADSLPQLTQCFQDLSVRVRALEQQLLDIGQHSLAAAVRRIQDNERTKLRTTLQLYALRKDHSFRALAFQHASPDDWSVPEGYGALRPSYVYSSSWRTSRRAAKSLTAQTRPISHWRCRSALMRFRLGRSALVTGPMCLGLRIIHCTERFPNVH